MQRRAFLGSLAAVSLSARHLRADLAIIGGGVGGCAAALTALRNNLTVVLSEETRWLGGQITSQLTPALDEHPWIESTGATRAYREFRNLIRQYYRDHYPLTPAARANSQFNPGKGWVSYFSTEPFPALQVLESLFAPYLTNGQLRLLYRHIPIAADTNQQQVRAVTLRSLDTTRELTIDAPYFLDATELGDLLPLTRTPYVTGFESRRDTQEPAAPPEAQPANEQSFTVCFACDYRPNEDHTIERPAEYGFWRDYVPTLKPAWPGKLLSLTVSNPKTHAPRQLAFDPSTSARQPAQSATNLWTYRRIAAKDHYNPGFLPSDIAVFNWPQNDYLLGRLIDVPPAEAQQHIQRGKQLSLSLLYWLQTEAPRPDGGAGWKGLRLRPDISGTEDGLAMYPYIRESRRIQAETTIVQQHLSPELRPNQAAEVYKDSCGLGSYRIDLHPSTGGDNYIDVSSLPFQIPFGALISKTSENLLPACKNIGTTHITNGCYRLHPVEWNIGEVAALAVVEALRLRQSPRAIRNTPKLLAAFQNRLREQGVDIAWPKYIAR